MSVTPRFGAGSLPENSTCGSVICATSGPEPKPCWRLSAFVAAANCASAARSRRTWRCVARATGARSICCGRWSGRWSRGLRAEIGVRWRAVRPVYRCCSQSKHAIALASRRCRRPVSRCPEAQPDEAPGGHGGRRLTDRHRSPVTGDGFPGCRSMRQTKRKTGPRAGLLERHRAEREAADCARARGP